MILPGHNGLILCLFTIPGCKGHRKGRPAGNRQKKWFLVKMIYIDGGFSTSMYITLQEGRARHEACVLIAQNDSNWKLEHTHTEQFGKSMAERHGRSSQNMVGVGDPLRIG